MLGKVIIYLISIILIINLLNLRGINIKLNKYQLQAYENLGSIRNSKLSYNRLKNVLKNINDFNYDVFIQGSYANKTNIPGDSDVDVIINLNDIFNHNINEHSIEIIVMQS
jgi:predicted nucleotidyltransferase